jgi:hypothetical protein
MTGEQKALRDLLIPIIIIILALGTMILILEYTCHGQCAERSEFGKTCQDRCFHRGFCPEADR